MSRAYESYVGALHSIPKEDACTVAATLQRLTLESSLRELTGQAADTFGRWIRQEDRTDEIKERLRINVEVAEDVELAAKELDERLTEEELPLEINRQFSGRLGLSLDTDETGPDWYRHLLSEIAKEFDVDASRLSDDSLAEHLFKAILDELIEAARKQLDEITPEQENEILKQMEDRLEDLSPEDKEKIKQELDIDQVSAQVLWELFRQGRLVAGGVIAAQAAGFGLYLAATTITHAIFTTLLGVTLSFGTYTTITSALAFLINPVTGLLVFAGLGAALLRRQDKKMDRRVCGFALLEIMGSAKHA